MQSIFSRLEKNSIRNKLYLSNSQIDIDMIAHGEKRFAG